jgi:hypothetical protein
MNKEQLHEMLLGLALVALGYAIYQHTKKASKQTQLKAPSVVAPSQGIAYNPANPGAYITLDNLIAGTVHDLATTPGGTAGYIPSTDDQINLAAGVAPSPARDSVFLPDAVPAWF